MDCYIYRSPRRAGTYLYLAREDDFECLPEGLLASFGQPEQFLHIELTAGRQLATEDADLVRERLVQDGWYLQLPPDRKPERVDQ